ncbi:MAG: phosphoglucosamine mutase, partial [Bdellovibrionales bacterium]
MAQNANLIVSVSGIRGIVGAGLSPESACAYSSALGTYLRGGKILLSRDGRPSGAMVRHAVLAGLLATGCAVEDLGVTPTPTVGFAIKKLKAKGAIQITASHNPAPWNGLKLFGEDGRVLSAGRGRELQALFTSANFHQVAWDQLGYVQDRAQALSWHRDRVLELVDVVRIRSRQMKVLVDANGGAGGPLARLLLQSLGCQAVILGGNADGDFAHEPEPLAENLQEVCPQVSAENAQLG